MLTEHAKQLAHFLRLLDDPGFGLDYVRYAVDVYRRLPDCPYPRIGFDIKGILDGRDAAKAAERLPGAD